MFTKSLHKQKNVLKLQRKVYSGEMFTLYEVNSEVYIISATRVLIVQKLSHLTMVKNLNGL